MASVMGICRGLAGPKSGNVEKPVVFVCFFDVFKNRGASKNGSSGASRSVLTSKKCYLSLKMLCGYIRNCASYAGGEHIFRRIMKTSGRKAKNGAGRP